VHSRNPDKPAEGAPSATPAAAQAAVGEETRSDPIAEARALLAQHQQERMQACAAELQAVLDRYGMRLEATPAHVTLTPAP